MNQLSKQYGTYERQQELLAMIKDVDKLFQDNGIGYSLGSGSLLGAIREKGFIPWDDDLDIMVDRENYEKILNLFQDKKNTEKYRINRLLWIDRIQNQKGEKENISTATIDIFVMDNCPDNIILYKVKVALIKILQGMIKKEKTKSNVSLFYRLCLTITHALGKPFSFETKFRWYQKVSCIGNKRPTKYMGGYNDLFHLLNLKYTNKLFNSILKAPFEDTTLPITAEYDSYLTTQYGDYMTPPPENERTPQHLP